ncbi:hypothetical protein E2C01_093921 [Portunus trituberculatus]|uniref:Uncharacterized protein n=1 Tax=Portunus trituberculatus TaxID=210409 RepID=A0A5B7JZF2_PORTR|nr:hypothetical protein [Portunus trituberculatus]
MGPDRARKGWSRKRTG